MHVDLRMLNFAEKIIVCFLLKNEHEHLDFSTLKSGWCWFLENSTGWLSCKCWFSVDLTCMLIFPRKIKNRLIFSTSKPLGMVHTDRIFWISGEAQEIWNLSWCFSEIWNDSVGEISQQRRDKVAPSEQWILCSASDAGRAFLLWLLVGNAWTRTCHHYSNTS